MLTPTFGWKMKKYNMHYCEILQEYNKDVHLWEAILIPFIIQGARCSFVSLKEKNHNSIGVEAKILALDCRGDFASLEVILRKFEQHCYGL